MSSNVYITKALRKDIPSDAILMTKAEAIERHWTTIKAWRPRSDTWPFTFGIGALVSLNAGTTINIVQYYRRRLKLGNCGRITMVLPAAVIPCIMSSFGHLMLVTNSVLAQDECPLCIQSRAAFIQVGLGVIYPVMVTPILACHYAYIYGTYDVPPLRRQYLSEFGRLWLDMTRRLKLRLPIAIILNALAASVLTYYEADSFYKVQIKILEKEKEFLNTIYDKPSQNS